MHPQPFKSLKSKRLKSASKPWSSGLNAGLALGRPNDIYSDFYNSKKIYKDLKSKILYKLIIDYFVFILHKIQKIVEKLIHVFNNYVKNILFLSQNYLNNFSKL